MKINLDWFTNEIQPGYDTLQTLKKINLLLQENRISDAVSDIQSLSCSKSDNNETQSLLGRSELGVLTVLDNALSKDINVLSALSALYHISKARYARSNFIISSVRLDRTLVMLLRGNSSEVQLLVTKILWNLSIENELCPLLSSKELNLIKSLETTLNSTNSNFDLKKNVLVILKNLATLNENKELICKEDKMLSSLVEVFITNYKIQELVDRVIGLLASLSAAKGNREYMGLEVKDVNACVMKVINETPPNSNHEAFSNCLSYFLNLSYSKNQLLLKTLGSKSLGLAPRLSICMIEGTPENRKKAMTCLWNLSVDNELSNYFITSEVNIKPSLIAVFHDEHSTDDERKSCLVIANNISVVSEGKSYLGNDENFLISLKPFLTSSCSMELQSLAVSLIFSLSLATTVRMTLLSTKLGLIPSYLGIVKSGTSEEVKINILSTLTNLSIDKHNREYFEVHNANLIDAVFEEMKTQSDSCHTIRLKSSMLLWNLSLGNKAIEVLNFKKEKYIPVLFELLRNETNEELLKNYMTVIKNLSYHSEMKIYLGNAANGWISLITHHPGILGSTELLSITLALSAALTYSKENRAYLSSEEAGIIEIVSKQFPHAIDNDRNNCIMTIWYLSIQPSARIIMANPDIEIILTLVRIIRENPLDSAAVKASNAIWNFSLESEICPYLASKELGLFPILKDIVDLNHFESSTTDEALSNAIVIIKNMASIQNKATRLYLASPELGLIESIVKYLRDNLMVGLTHLNSKTTDKLERISKCIIGINKLSYEKSCLKYFGSRELGLIEIIVKLSSDLASTMKNENVPVIAANIRSDLLSLIWTISVEKSVRKYLGSPDLGLLQYLIAVIKEGRGIEREKSLNTIWNLSIDNEVCTFLGLRNLGLLNALVEVLALDNGESLTAALVIVKNIAVVQNLRLGMGDPRLRLVACLKKIVLDYRNRPAPSDGSQKDGNIALSALCYIASGQKKKYFIDQPDILAIVRDAILSGDMDEKLTALNGVLILTLSDECLNRCLLNPSLGLVSNIVDLLALSETSPQRNLSIQDVQELKRAAISPLWNIVEHGDESDVIELLNLNTHKHVLNMIRDAGPDQSTWGAAHSIISKCLNFVMNLARHEISDVALKETDAFNIVHPLVLIESNGSERTKATFIVIFLIGRDENGISDTDSIWSSISGNENKNHGTGLIDNVIEVFQNTLEGKGGHDYPLGTFCLKLIVHACLALSVSDKNKVYMTKRPFLPLLVQTLNLYVYDAPPIPRCGGGGNDHECAELAIETIFQLSFAFEDNEALRSSYMTAETGVSKLMAELCGQSKLSIETRRSASLLLGKLRTGVESLTKNLSEKSLANKNYLKSKMSDRSNPLNANLTANSKTFSMKANEAMTSSSHGALNIDTDMQSAKSNDKRTHIMLSYSWNSAAKPQYVKEMGRLLKEMNYDVWRDEEGSSIVEAMGGALDDRMAEALEKSSHLIICVSKPYKESANCRMEAKYASQLQKRNAIKILYVMMQNEYTTNSAEPCDGWLGIMIGDSVWYPLWDSNIIPDTATKLTNMIGNISKLSESDSPFPSARDRAMTPFAPPVLNTTGSSTFVNTNQHPYNFLLDSGNKIFIDDDFNAVKKKFEKVGLESLEDFNLLESSELLSIANLLKNIPKKKFLKMIETRIKS